MVTLSVLRLKFKTIAEKFTLDYNNSIYLKYEKNIEGTNS